MKKLLPQANNLDTVIKVFVYACNKENCTQNDIARFCDFEPRQAAYYLNACYYLGLLDENGNRNEVSDEILSQPQHVKLKVYERIITDPIIGKIFTHRLLFPEDDQKEFATNLLYENYPEYSEAVILRRASTLLKWCDEIFESPAIRL